MVQLTMVGHRGIAVWLGVLVLLAFLSLQWAAALRPNITAHCAITAASWCAAAVAQCVVILSTGQTREIATLARMVIGLLACLLWIACLSRAGEKEAPDTTDLYRAVREANEADLAILDRDAKRALRRLRSL